MENKKKIRRKEREDSILSPGVPDVSLNPGEVLGFSDSLLDPHRDDLRLAEHSKSQNGQGDRAS